MVCFKTITGVLACASSITASPVVAERISGGAADVALVPRYDSPSPVSKSPLLTRRDSADIGDKSSAVGAIGDVVNKVVQLVQGMIDDDIKVSPISPSRMMKQWSC